ncbi:rhodanese-like domain-containing protein [Aequorivita viscosa]|jgi:rhodanese-related sulfurtransferase|nr:rhodanese-like domain-containing protein [Aequorivita viscosa]
MKHLSILLLLFLFAENSFAQKNLDQLLQAYNSYSIPYISVQELRMFQLNDTVIILDAREPDEFAVSHIKTALNVGYNDFHSEEKQLQKLNKNIPIVVYCSVGIRSEKIGEKLKKIGFTNVKNLYGGIFEWKYKGYPVIDPAGKNTENIHVFSKHWSSYLNAGNPVY